MGARLSKVVRSVLGSSLLSLAATLLFFLPAQAQTVYWELEPKKDAAASIGTFTAVGGKTTPDGVNFTLKNNSIDMPQVLTLISKVVSSRLHLSAFKEAEPFLEKDTDGEGRLVVKFRTSEDIRFRITGPAGADYQLSVWRGPDIKLPQPAPVVSMESVIGKNAAATPPNTMATRSAEQPTQRSATHEEKPSGGSNTLIYLLLAAILVALGVIAVLIYRGQTLNQNSGRQE